LRRLTGIRIQEQYNVLLQNGWTLGSVYLLRLLQATIRLFHRPLVNLLENFWREKPADLLVSVIPHFIAKFARVGAKFIRAGPSSRSSPTWPIFHRAFGSSDERAVRHCRTERAAQQARALGHDEAHIFRTSGMILRPDFYAPDNSDPIALRKELGLRPDLTTAIVLFGGHGSKVMYDIASRLDAAMPLSSSS